MTTKIIWPGWKTVRQIGAGSFGKVYEIEREENGVLKRSALKVMSVPVSRDEVQSGYENGYFDTEEGASTFYSSQIEAATREMSMMSELRGNKNIVSYEGHLMIPHDDWVGGDILLKMELLTPLTRYRLSHPLTEEDVVRLGMDICRALDVCQRKVPPILHRDIKPANIMVDDSGNFKLGDFGVARFVEGTRSAHTVAGTEDYMAPEVMNGQSYNATADIYSLGLVLYKLLNNNRSPFLPTEGNMTAEMHSAAKMKRLNGDRIPPPLQGSNTLKWAVLKAVQYRKEDRWQTALEFYQALERCAFSGDNQTTYSDRTVEESTVFGGAVQQGSAAVLESTAQSQNEYSETVLGGATVNQPNPTESVNRAYQYGEPRTVYDDQPGQKTVLDSAHSSVGQTVRERNHDTQVKSKPKAAPIIVAAVVLIAAIVGLSLRKPAGSQVPAGTETTAIAATEDTQVEEDKSETTTVSETSSVGDNGTGMEDAETNATASLSGTLSKDKLHGIFAKNRERVKTIVFLNTLKEAPDNAEDFSESLDRSVLGWMEGHTLTLAGEGSIVAPEDSSNLFGVNYVWETLETVVGAEYLDTSMVNTMNQMFLDCSKLNSIDISKWDTSNVTDMCQMFEFCSSITALNLSKWNTSSVKDMTKMFYCCYGLTELNLSGWDTSNVKKMRLMFENCKNIKDLDVTGWDTSSVTDMTEMFCHCEEIETLDLSGWDLSSIADRWGMYRLFYKCKNLKTLDVTGWDPPELDEWDIEYMFKGTKLASNPPF